jgi:translocator protein
MVKAKEAAKLLGLILLIEAIGNIGTIFTAPAISGWYTTLAKPAWTPPNWVFAPIWLTLYALMGTSLYLVLFGRKHEKSVTVQLVAVFSIQLALNVAWSIEFFGFKNIFMGFAIIMFLWLTIAQTIYMFAKTRRISALPLVPYIVWVTIAAALNFSILMLNH